MNSSIIYDRLLFKGKFKEIDNKKHINFILIKYCNLNNNNLEK